MAGLESDRRHSRWLVPGLFAVVLSASMLFTALAGAAQSPQAVKGDISFQSVTGGTCASAVDLCFSGTLTGKLKGTFTSTATSLIQSADTPTTGVVFLTADVVVQTTGVTVILKDASALHTTGAGEFAGLWTLIGGTGSFAGATGVLQVTGNFDSAAGVGSGRYVGSIFLP